MLTNQDLQSILRVIYDPNTPHESRVQAEHRLDTFQNLEGSWKIHIDLITSERDEQMLFMLCFGLNKILWKSWSTISEPNHDMIASVMINFLIERFNNLPLYARSKVEQVIATLCKNYVSYDVGFKLVNACNNSPNSHIISISVFRTILEESLSNDTRLSPDKRSKLSKDALDIAPQLVSLACNACVTAIQSCEYNVLTTSLNLLKIIISKIPIGPHVNNETLNLLFSIAELASTSTNFNEPSLNAVEALSEFMNKRYIPPSSDGSLQAKEAIASVLVDLVSKAVNLIRKYW